MSGERLEERRKTSNKIIDVIVIIFCISGAAVSLFLFYQDLFMTFRSKDILPAGNVEVKYNTVQRRLNDRVVWDRLSKESPVYSGDLIRIARLSGATINIDNNIIELGENTLIRIQKDEEGKSFIQINFYSGDLKITSNEDNGVVRVAIGDKIVETAPGTVFTAASGDEGIVMRVTEGSAQILNPEGARNIQAGETIALDQTGSDVSYPVVSVMQPRPNARYLNAEPDALNVNFTWVKLNMNDTDFLKLEISQDRNFSRIAQTIDNLNSNAAVSVNDGYWYWRLSLEDKVLSLGRFSVTKAQSPALYSPVNNHLFQTGRAGSAREEVQFRWENIPEASHYILQVSKFNDFYNQELSAQVQGTSYVSALFESGTWYWRVMPVFPSVFEGRTYFSRVSSFRVETVREEAVSEERITNEETAARTEDQLELLSEQIEPSDAQQSALDTPEIAIAQQQTPSITPAQTVQQQTPSLTPAQTVQQQTPPSTPAQTVQQRAPPSTPPQTVQQQAPPPPAPPVIATLPPLLPPPLPPSLHQQQQHTETQRQQTETPPQRQQIPMPALTELAAPLNLQPEPEHIIDIQRLRRQRELVLSWSRVQWAHSYIVTIYRETMLGHQQVIFQTETNDQTRYVLDDLTMFENRNYVWQVEAVVYDESNRVILRSEPAVSSFTFDIPRPGRVIPRDMGVLYGIE